MIEVDLLLKLDKLLRVFDPVHIPKKRQPKRLALAFFVAFALSCLLYTSPDLVGKRWYLNIFVREQPAVNIRECSQIRVVIL